MHILDLSDNNVNQYPISEDQDFYINGNEKLGRF